MIGGGYIRRKVTYNIGRTNRVSNSGGKDNVSWGHSHSPSHGERVVIVDNDGQVDSTWETVKDNPDWYEFIDTAELNGDFIYYYRIRAGPPV